MNCAGISELLTAYLDNEVTPEERRRVENHLSTCDACREELKLLGTTQNNLRQALKSKAEGIESSPQAWNAVRDRISSSGSFWERLSKFMNSPGLRMAVPLAVLVVLAAGLIWHAGIFSSPATVPPPSPAAQGPTPPTTTPLPPLGALPPTVPAPTPTSPPPAAIPPTTTPPPVVNVAPSQVTVQPPNVTVNPPAVNVATPEPAQVTIQPPPATVPSPPPANVQINVPPQIASIPGDFFLLLLIPVGLAIALILAVVWTKRKR